MARKAQVRGGRFNFYDKHLRVIYGLMVFIILRIVLDFSTFLAYPGCTKSKHSAEKTAEAVRLTTQTEIRPEKQEEVIVWNGLNEPDKRPEKDQEFAVLVKNPSAGLVNAVTKFMEENVNRSLSELAIGTTCKNLGCKQVNFWSI